jgi:hypothetical protein
MPWLTSGVVELKLILVFGGTLNKNRARGFGLHVMTIPEVMLPAR